MKFRAQNCHLFISLNPALYKCCDQYEFFSKIGDEFVCDIGSDDSTLQKKSIRLELPADAGAKIVLEQCQLSIINATGSIQLELYDCEALLVNLKGNLSVVAKNSMIRCIGGNGELKADIKNCDLTGVFSYSPLVLHANSSNVELSSKLGCEAVWSFSGEDNRILFDPLLKSNLMINSDQNDWVHSSANPEIFINIFGEQRCLGFFDNDPTDHNKMASVDSDNLETQDFFTESLETVKSNEDLMNMFDHYEDQLNIQMDEFSESSKLVVDGKKLCSNTEEYLVDHSKISIHQRQIMNLHLNGQISLSEMELLLKDLVSLKEEE